MPRAAPDKPKRETWRDWLPPGVPEPEQRFTREEVVEWLAKRHVAGMRPISAGDIAYWERIGVLPSGVRQWHEGSARALYPHWYWLLARQVRALQHAGFSLDEIRPRIRTHARLMLAHSEDLNSESPTSPSNVRSPEDIQLWPDLVAELERLARWRAALTGVATDRVEVHVVGADGWATKYPLPVGITDEATEENA